MLSSALEAFGLPQCEAVLGGEFKRVVGPHWQAAVIAVAGLMGEGVGAGTHQSVGHVKLLKSG